MDEYIDKNATVGILEAMSRSADCECIKKRLEKAAKRVNTIPAADVAPMVHGRWKYYHKQNKAVCMRCSFERDLDENFGAAISCPNCGAKME